MHLRRQSRPDLIGHAVDAIAAAAFGTRLIWPNQPDPFDDLNSQVLLPEPVRKARTVCDCRAMAWAICATLAPSGQGRRQHLCLLGAFTRLSARAGCHSQP